MKLKAFGKYISREKAIEIIIEDFKCSICYARNTDVLEELLCLGWKGLEKWSNKGLEEYISGLSEENQPYVINKFRKKLI